ncbi:alpha-2-glucosyltransferase Alg10 [Mycotypha africana]|uniref:alpha-2-glucosyltransferase Alg10 n=1 Tax=Mycotypha africana TaxID=64632 RepID=UPI0022FFC574|nr:alpha-2-glucosyltransferase Alg10 [Mycotypha africana]KAI8975572.1 alpha-2-glucosyltransferase Alg10 [Mycotypha africana]
MPKCIFMFDMFFLLHVLGLYGFAKLINDKVPDPYMDEIFHIPQAQQYCRGRYTEWDPKLTTPPGLYLASNSVAYMGGLFGYDFCTVNALRFTNILFSVGLYFTILSLVSQRTATSQWKAQMYALALSWFPVGYFYNFLYYTDTGSTFLVLLSYLCVTKKMYHLSGIIGTLSLTFRQTNIIWLGLFMMISIINILTKKANAQKKDHKNSQLTALYNPLCSTIKQPSQIFKSIYSLVIATFNNLPLLLPNVITFMLGIVLFSIFLVWNKGIVLGDKSNHVAGLHFPQLFYYMSFLTFFAAPWTISRAMLSSIIYQISVRRVVYGCLSTTIALYLVYRYTYEHPFLLSDNRHYSFYVWKKIYRRHWAARYFLTPVYIFCSQINFLALVKNVSLLVTLGYLFTLILMLVPSPLLEFRYFISPFLFYMVNIPPPSQLRRLIVGMIFFLIVNFVTIYLFVYKPFTWVSEPNNLQRFMW